MALCAICFRPVMLDFERLEDGELCHRPCRHVPRPEKRSSTERRPVAGEKRDPLFDELLGRRPT